MSFGFHSSIDRELAARMFSVVTTLRTQGRSMLDFLIPALRSESPSLLSRLPEYSVSRMDEVRKIPLNPRQSFYLGKPQDHAASPS